MGRCCVLFLSCFVSVFWATTALAQQAEPATPPAQRGTGSSLLDRFNSKQLSITCEGERCDLKGEVEFPIDSQTMLFANEVEVHRDTNRLVARGNVVFSGMEGRLAAERVDYDVAKGTGVFYMASGLMSLGTMADPRQFGDQEADVYFVGETIEKLGPRKYKITRGGFTTCVQPTPRWQMTSGSVTLNLNDYAIARSTVLRVKGVPIMYLPLVYYPIQDDDRATGFLLPTYGTSTVRGQAISNAFFWAINRSQDATFFHDWYTRTGQGYGSEYRYVAGGASNGDVRFYRFDQQQVQFDVDQGGGSLPSSKSFEITGNVNQVLSRSIRARARLDYFSDFVTQQLYHQNLYYASRNRRLIEAGLIGGFGPLSTSVLYQRQEIFNSETSTTVYGSTPRVTASLAPQRLFNAPVYASLNSEFAFLPYRSISDGDVVSDTSFNRLDISPTIRMPLSRLPFLSVNASAAYRTTRYSRSVVAGVSGAGGFVDEPYLRQYTSLRAEIVGPVFTRIWDVNSGFVERIKHVIEPAFTVDFTSEIGNFRRTPTTSDLSDFVVSGTTRTTYGITNRVFSRARAVDGARGQTREMLTVGLQQTFYSNPLSAQFDLAYQSSYGIRPEDFSPVSLTARVSPTNTFDISSRVEYDVSHGDGLRNLSIGSNFNAAAFSVGTTYSHSNINPSNPYNFLTATTSLRGRNGRVTNNYNISWDIEQARIVSQGLVFSYLAQCCGLQLEFQRYNYPQSSSIPVSADTRFNFGFILAGLGTFSNFFGAFGGQR
jgi:LPS-assembly protein